MIKMSVRVHVCIVITMILCSAIFLQNCDDDSDHDSVAIHPASLTANNRPIANAGSDQTVMLGELVTLDGSGSSDKDGDSLSYNWSFVSTPFAHNQDLLHSSSMTSMFNAYAEGTYVIRLTVNDGILDSYEDTVRVKVLLSNSGPVCDAGPDQIVTTGTLVTLDASGSTDTDDNPLTYRWDYYSKPEGSNAILSNPHSVKPTFIPDIDGSYTFQLIVSDGFLTSTPDLISVVAEPGYISRLSFRVIDAEYSKQLDKIIMVSDTPSNQLHIYDPETEEDTVLDLDLPPTCVSVSPDGKYAATGHDGLMYYINLLKPNDCKKFELDADVYEIVLADNGFAYAFSKTVWPCRIRCVNLTTGEITQHGSTGNTTHTVTNGTKARLHPYGNMIFGANSSYIEKYDVSDGVALYLEKSECSGAKDICSDFWFSEDGLIKFTRCGIVFGYDPEVCDDLTYNGSIEGIDLIKHLSHSEENNKFVLIQDNDSGCNFRDTEIQKFEDVFFSLEKRVELPQFEIQKKTYAGHGMFVFHNSAGNRVYVVVQVDEYSGSLKNFRVVTYGSDLQPLNK